MPSNPSATGVSESLKHWIPPGPVLAQHLPSEIVVPSSFPPWFLRPPVPPFTTGNMVYGEDCLTLNVVRPAGIPNLKKLLVAMWIHGGGFYIGGSAWPYTNISTFVHASQQAGTPIIAVSINYRLGILGFLAGSELTIEGNINLGLHDQRMALRWVHENIASFGGDPEKVTIFGESAYVPRVELH